VIPALNDHEIEALLEAAAAHGASRAGFMPLRLPGEVANLFEAWLHEHYPLRAGRVIGLVRGMRGGRLNDPRFGHRMRGEGPYAQLLSARFAAACRRVGLDAARAPALDTSSFLRDPAAPLQADLFS
jgi:DNA repair photolyase